MSDAPTPKPAAPAAGRAGMKKELPEHFKAYRHVWVAMEMERGQVHPVSFELLGEGRKLADKLGVELAGVVMGPPARKPIRPSAKRSPMARTLHMSSKTRF